MTKDMIVEYKWFSIWNLLLSHVVLGGNYKYSPWQWHLAQSSLELSELALNDLKNTEKYLYGLLPSEKSN